MTFRTLVPEADRVDARASDPRGHVGPLDLDHGSIECCSFSPSYAMFFETCAIWVHISLYHSMQYIASS